MDVDGDGDVDVDIRVSLNLNLKSSWVVLMFSPVSFALVSCIGSPTDTMPPWHSCQLVRKDSSWPSAKSCSSAKSPPAAPGSH